MFQTHCTYISSFSFIIIITYLGSPFFRLINPFVTLDILFQSFLYIIACCLYLLVLHSMSSITQFVFLLFQAMFPWNPFWILAVSQHFYVILFWLLILLFGVYLLIIISQYVHNSNAIMILFYLLLV